ncbi:carbohydrate ABC transporter permease [Metabacillus arenae]|uniref:Carbohydrate ABC transporter permease n=1 Tax=Metabacillus arenae TaxID=2771434 RepID=A0A926RXM3_9BACI|nr:carbohydrate ABC transporter permease [Metabacillus arenae]MBD1382038.1 carbohydrate ABC transporter permease [Metabacillus arenae]
MNRYKNSSGFISYVILIPIALFALFPFYIMFKSSFEPLSQIISSFHFFPESWLYLENFKEVFEKYPISRWFINSFIIAIIAVIGNLVFCPLIAYALARLEFKGKKLLFFVVIATLIIPVQVLVVPLYLMLAPLGLQNNFIAVILPDLVSPFGVFLLRQAFLALPYELEEAAFMDGCGRIRSLFKIIIPNALPTLCTIAVLKFMWVWGDFMWPSLILTKEHMKTLPIGIASFQTTSSLVPWGLVISASVIAVVPIILLFFMLQKYFVRGLTDGAVKG